MPRKQTEEAKAKKFAYDTEYMKHMVSQKTIGFNKGNEEDMKMLDWINQQHNQTQYLKGLIKEDMSKAGK